MTSSLLLIVPACIFTGLISIDRAAFGQFMLSRPVVAASLLGLFSGCLVEGAIAGLIFELLFLNSLPVGSAIPDEALFPALLTVLMVKMNGGFTSMPIAVTVALPSLFLDRLADRQWRRSNERTFHKAEVFIRLGRADLAERLHLIAILRTGLFNTVAFFVSWVLLFPVYSLVLNRLNGLNELFSSTGVVPLLAGMAALTFNHLRSGRWIGFGIGLGLGILTGIW